MTYEELRKDLTPEDLRIMFPFDLTSVKSIMHVDKLKIIYNGTTPEDVFKQINSKTYLI